MIKVEIPDNLFEKIKNRADQSKFNDVDSYIVHILEQVLLNLEKEENISRLWRLCLIDESLSQFSHKRRSARRQRAHRVRAFALAEAHIGA